MDQTTKNKLDAYVADYLKGDSRALSLIVDLLGAPVFSFVLKCGVPEPDAADLTNAFLFDLFDKKIWRYEPRPGSAFWSWVCAVVSNAVKDWRKAREADKET